MDADQIKKEWLLQNEKICLCKAIPRKRIIAAISKGADSVAAVNAVVGSGSGECSLRYVEHGARIRRHPLRDDR